MTVVDDRPAAPAAPHTEVVERAFDRTPPHDYEAEQAAIGAMLLSDEACGDVVEIVQPNDFYRPIHSTIFEAVRDLHAVGVKPDSILVAKALADASDLVRVGGAPYLHTLISMVPTAANAAYYARIVVEKAVLRRMIEAGTKIVQLGYGSAKELPAGRTLADITDLAQRAVMEVTDTVSVGGHEPIADLMDPTLEEIEAIGKRSGEMTGIPTGFTDLDRLLQGLHGGQLIIVAARPGIGKSTATCDFARNTAIRHGNAAAIFSLEMSKTELMMRILSAEARVPLHVIRSGNLSDDDWTRLARAMGEIAEAPLFLDDTPSMNLMQIRAAARRLKRRHDLKLIVVDYLQLMTSPKRTESRQQEVADLSRGLKLLAKEVGVPVIAVCQLNRGPEQRTDKRPQLSDLRESGSLEQDADVVLLLHRDDYYDKESPRRGEADFILAKHRNGPTDTVTVAAQLHLSRFVDMAIG